MREEFIKLQELISDFEMAFRSKLKNNNLINSTRGAVMSYISNHFKEELVAYEFYHGILPEEFGKEGYASFDFSRFWDFINE